MNRIRIHWLKLLLIYVNWRIKSSDSLFAGKWLRVRRGIHLEILLRQSSLSGKKYAGGH